MPSNLHVAGTVFAVPLPQVAFGETSIWPPEHVPLGALQEQALQLRPSVTPVSTRDFVEYAPAGQVAFPDW